MLHAYDVLVWLSTCLSFVKCQTHAFVQVDSELQYLVDGIHIPMNEILEVKDTAEQRTDSLYGDRLSSKSILLFDPPFLGFKEHPTGIPKIRKVFVQNTSPDTSIHLHSLSGNTMHFHCTFFQDKTILPGGNTSFDVVFLGREEGFIENTIYVHTSVGTYRYWVKSVGTSNPYRIRPLIGLRMPLNSSFTSSVQIHNPHSQNMKVIEMYSTGGDLHLELPDGLTDEPGHWTIPPFQTKALMKATFVARRENNHTAYIRVVPDKPVSDFLAIPVEVEVSSEQGLYFPSDCLYFGMLTVHDPPVSLPLYLLNSAHKHIHIQNIITSSVNEAITIDFKPVKIPPGTVHPTQVATITFNPAKVRSGEKVTGKLLIKSKISAYKLAVPFNVDLHQGEIFYNTSLTRFYTGPDATQLNEEFASLFSSTPHYLMDIKGGFKKSVTLPRENSNGFFQEDSEPHPLILKNAFNVPIVVFNITLADNAIPHFQVKWNGPVIIEEGEKECVANIALLSKGTNLHMKVDLTVHTNVTTINISLIAYNGKLTKYILQNDSKETLDFGTLGMGEQHNNYFYLLNENPVSIHFKGWGSSLSHIAVELMGVVEGNLSSISRHPNKTLNRKNLFLKPMHYAVFRIGVLTPESEGIYIAEAFVRTQYQVIIVPFRLRTASGLLTIFPNTISLENSFPGKVSEQDLHILSTFGHTMSVEGISPEVPDVRFAYKPPDGLKSSLLRPGHRSHAGKIVFDPAIDCMEECYAGFTIHSKVGQQWMNTLALNSQTYEWDVNCLNTLKQRFDEIPSHSFNSSLFLDTSEVRGHRFNTKVSLIWPQLVEENDLEFPLTPLHSTSFINLTLNNPASHPVFAQLLFLHDYPIPESAQSSFFDGNGNKKLRVEWKELLEESSSSMFYFQSQSLEKDKLTSCDPSSEHLSRACSSIAESVFENEQQRKLLEMNFKMRFAKDSLALLLQPNSQLKMQIAFTPVEERRYSTVVLLRNNLTVLESIRLEGSGGIGHLTLEKINPKAMNLHFFIQENPKNCTFVASQMERQISLYAKYETFFIKNDGKLPIEVSSFKVGNAECYNYGFRIVNCSSFLLLPNRSHKVEVMFIPDFSLYHVDQTLIIETSLKSVGNFSHTSPSLVSPTDGHFYLQLVGTVAPPTVVKCAEQMSRPTWEPLMYYSVVTLLVAMFLGTIIRSFLEAEYTIRTSFVPMVTLLPANQQVPSFDKNKVFDLQAIEKSLRDECDLSAEAVSDEGVANKFDDASSSKASDVSGPSLMHKPCNLQFDKPKYSSTSFNNYTADTKREKDSISSEKCKFGAKAFPKNNLSLSFSSLLPLSLRKNTKRIQNTIFQNNKLASSKTCSKRLECNNIDYELIEQRMPPARNNYLNAKGGSTPAPMDASNSEDSSSYSKGSVSSDGEKPKKKNPKTSVKKEPQTHTSYDQIESSHQIEAAFEINIKSKGIKKIKEMPHRKGGSQLELPYTLKPSPKQELEHDAHPKVTKKTKKVLGYKDNLCNITTPTVSKVREAAPIPPHEPPERRAPAKAIVAPRVQPQIQPLAPRDPSYSAVVLGNTKRTKETPVGKIVPERKYIEKAEQPLGIIGQRLVYPNIMSDMGAPPNSMGLKPCPPGLPPCPPPSFSAPQDTNIQSLYSRGLATPGNRVAATPQQVVSCHSWDPQTLSSPPRIHTLHQPQMAGLDKIRKSAMTDDDWLPFDESNLSSFWNAEAESSQPYYEKPVSAAPSPPSPSLWESLSFSIWSSPWSADLTQSSGRNPKPSNYNVGSSWQENYPPSDHHSAAPTGVSGPKVAPFSYKRYIPPNTNPDGLQDNH